MPILNSAKGLIKKVLFYDNTGGYLSAYKSIASSFQKGVCVIFLINPDSGLLETLKKELHHQEPSANLSAETLDIVNNAEISELITSEQWKKVLTEYFEFKEIPAVPLIFSNGKSLKKLSLKASSAKFTFLSSAYEFEDVQDQIEVVVPIKDELADIQDEIEILQSLKGYRIVGKQSVLNNLGYAPGNTNNEPQLPTHVPRLEGGDLIAGDDFLLIGLTALTGTELQKPEKLAQLKDEYARYYNYKPSEIFFIGMFENVTTKKGFTNPFYHLDTYLTYLGNKDDKPLFALASLTEIVNSENKIDEEYLRDCLNMIYYQLLLTFNFNVSIIRIPCIIIPNRNFDVVIGYNNILVEQDNDPNISTRVYLPYYTSSDRIINDKLIRLCDETLAIFDSNGIEYKYVGYNFYTTVTTSRVGLHCAAKVLERG